MAVKAEMSNKDLVYPGEPGSGQECNLHSCRYASRLMAVIFISPGPHKEGGFVSATGKKEGKFFGSLV